MSAQSVSMNIDTGEKTWLTPKWIIDVLGAFDLDPCCPDGEMPWRTADRMVRKSEDGLLVDWRNKRVWLNPPYGKEALPFFRKMIDDDARGIALVFARTDTKLCSSSSSLMRIASCFCQGVFVSAVKTVRKVRPLPLRVR